MKVLITGGTGLIGSEFKSELKVSRKNCDITNYHQLMTIFENHKPEAVIHAAARVGGVAANTRFMYDFFYQNILMNTNIVDIARQFGVKKLIGFSSTCVFPDKIEYPLRENQMHDGPPHSSNYAYAYAKRMMDVQIQASNQQFDTKYFTVIPTNVYGPRDNYDLENGHVLPSLIHRCYLSKIQETDFEVWGSGNPLREFVYSKDVATICEILLEKYQDSEPVIISNSNEISIKRAVEIITSLLDFKGNVIWNTNKPEGQFRKPTNTDKLKSIIGKYDFVSLEKGLEETIEYFVKNYDTVRK